MGGEGREGGLMAKREGEKWSFLPVPSFLHPAEEMPTQLAGRKRLKGRQFLLCARSCTHVGHNNRPCNDRLSNCMATAGKFMAEGASCNFGSGRQ